MSTFLETAVKIRLWRRYMTTLALEILPNSFKYFPDTTYKLRVSILAIMVPNRVWVFALLSWICFLFKPEKILVINRVRILGSGHFFREYHPRRGEWGGGGVGKQCKKIIKWRFLDSLFLLLVRDSSPNNVLSVCGSPLRSLLLKYNTQCVVRELIIKCLHSKVNIWLVFEVSKWQLITSLSKLFENLHEIISKDSSIGSLDHMYERGPWLSINW